MSSDSEDDLFSSDEEGEHDVEKVMPLLRLRTMLAGRTCKEFLDEEAVGKGTLTCHFSFGLGSSSVRVERWSFGWPM